MLHINETIKNALENNYTQTEELIEVLSLAAMTGQPVLLYNALPGYYNHQMIMNVFHNLINSGKGANICFHDGGSFNSNHNNPIAFYKTLKFMIEGSDYILLENLIPCGHDVYQIFYRVFTELKDDLKGKLIIATIEDNPLSFGDSYNDLFQYFPLQCRLGWNSYSTEDYQEYLHIINKNHVLKGKSYIQCADYHINLLADLCEECKETSAYYVTPLEADNSLLAIKATALAKGCHQVAIEHFEALKYLAPFKKHKEKILRLIHDEQLKDTTRERFDNLHESLRKTINQINNDDLSDTDKKMMRDGLMVYLSILNNLDHHVSFRADRDNLLNQINNVLKLL